MTNLDATLAELGKHLDIPPVRLDARGMATSRIQGELLHFDANAALQRLTVTWDIGRPREDDCYALLYMLLAGNARRKDRLESFFAYDQAQDRLLLALAFSYTECETALYPCIVRAMEQLPALRQDLAWHLLCEDSVPLEPIRGGATPDCCFSGGEFYRRTRDL